MEGILIPISMFAAVFGVLYVYFTTRNKERLLMIEKGVDPSIFVTKKKNTSNMTLKFGMLFVGIAVGILAGALLAPYVNEEAIAYFSMILLFGGGSLILNANMEKKASKQE